jgi:hypothetical protein
MDLCPRVAPEDLEEGRTPEEQRAVAQAQGKRECPHATAAYGGYQGRHGSRVVSQRVLTGLPPGSRLKGMKTTRALRARVEACAGCGSPCKRTRARSIGQARYVWQAHVQEQGLLCTTILCRPITTQVSGALICAERDPRTAARTGSPTATGAAPMSGRRHAGREMLSASAARNDRVALIMASSTPATNRSLRGRHGD